MTWVPPPEQHAIKNGSGLGSLWTLAGFVAWGVAVCALAWAAVRLAGVGA